MNRGPHERGKGGSRPPAGSSQRNAGSSERSSAEPKSNGGNGNGAPRRNFGGPRKPMGRNPSEYRMRLERLRGARDADEIKQATDAYLQHHQLPDDVDILYKVLQHPSEKVVREALGQISSLIIQGRIQSNPPLHDRLEALAQQVTEDATRSFVEGVRSQLSGLKK